MMRREQIEVSLANECILIACLEIYNKIPMPRIGKTDCHRGRLVLCLEVLSRAAPGPCWSTPTPPAEPS